MKKSVPCIKLSYMLGLCLALLSSCVQIQRSENIIPQAQKAEEHNSYNEEIHVFVTQPTARAYQETMRYEAIGSNISSFEQVLNRVKQRARKDGCEALVQVKFYRQIYGNGKLGSSFPKIEAVGIRYTDEFYGQTRLQE